MYRSLHRKPSNSVILEGRCSEFKSTLYNSHLVGGGGARRRDAPDARGCWRASVLRGEEAGRFREVAAMSIVAAGGPHSR